MLGRIILYFVLWLVGTFVGAFGLIQPMICARFGNPFATQVENETGVNLSLMKRGYRVTIIFYTVIIALVVVLGFIFLRRDLFFALLIGMVGSLITGFGKTGMNQANLEDFLNNCSRQLGEEDFEKVKNYVLGE